MTSNKGNECTLQTVTKALEKEVIENQQAHIKFLMSNHDNYIESIIKQLSFRMSSIIETEDLGNLKYKTELLKTEDDDYKFILRSIEHDKSSTTNTKVLQVFKINPVYKSEEAKLKGETFCLMVSSRIKLTVS